MCLDDYILYSSTLLENRNSSYKYVLKSYIIENILILVKSIISLITYQIYKYINHCCGLISRMITLFCSAVKVHRSLTMSVFFGKVDLANIMHDLLFT